MQEKLEKFSLFKARENDFVQKLICAKIIFHITFKAFYEYLKLVGKVLSM